MTAVIVHYIDDNATSTGSTRRFFGQNTVQTTMPGFPIGKPGIVV